ncbi:MAG TPA: hypothetical protein VEF72_26200 [Mycobacterium sp.]|nr:hypothetical protein [Mycobacterium sp.]
MMDVEGTGSVDETPEADAAEQQRAVDVDDETGLDTASIAGDIGDRDASEADLIDQAIVVSLADDERDVEY